MTALLNAPVAASADVSSKLVWQCSIRTAPGDRLLSDDEWAGVAREVVARAGIAPYGDDGAVRWVAVRHADDHIHIVATLARQDGAAVRLWQDYPKVRSACMDIEARLELRPTAPADKTAAARASRAETEKAARTAGAEPVRDVLRRAVREAAAGAFTEADFWSRLTTNGVTVKHRMSERNPGEITGYAVALTEGNNAQLRCGQTGGGAFLFFSGGKLAPDLSLPKLRARWEAAAPPLGTPKLTAQQREHFWQNATVTAAHAAEHVREHTAAGSYQEAADAAWATSDVLASAARLIEGDERGNLHHAADDYDRAAREVHRRIPRRTGMGEDLRMTAVMLAAIRQSGGQDKARGALLMIHLAALADAVHNLRVAQDRGAQALAARRVAERIHAARQPANEQIPVAAGAASMLRKRQHTDEAQRPASRPKQVSRHRGVP